jgi:hypothetical protein
MNYWLFYVGKWMSGPVHWLPEFFPQNPALVSLMPRDLSIYLEQIAGL